MPLATVTIEEKFNPMTFSTFISKEKATKTTTAAITLAVLFTPFAAIAAPEDSPDWGIFEGRIGSLLHPTAMGSLLLFSLFTGYLGLLIRRQRSLGNEISTLKKSLPDLKGSKTIEEAISKAEEGSEDDGGNVTKLKAALPIEEQVNALVKERKDLTSRGLKEQHFNQGALLAFIGTSFAMVGPLNTYARAGKLFPGPHLYGGAALVVLWAAAAACVPYMQKGNDTARSLHIAANTLGTGIFAWQLVSGWPILTKVVELTKWP